MASILKINIELFLLNRKASWLKLVWYSGERHKAILALLSRTVETVCVKCHSLISDLKKNEKTDVDLLSELIFKAGTI